MKVTINWLKEFLDIDHLDPYEIADLLTMSGSEVKKVEDKASTFKNIIVGEIVSFEHHPDADKLSVCKVNTGKDVLSIVCGASNFKAGDRVAVALENAKTVQGIKIKKSKLRGVVSEGMMCSEYELGISQDSEGIMILDKNYSIGKGFAEQTGLDDFVLELEITPNRPDCMSIMGIAREISVLKGTGFKTPGYDIEKELNNDKGFKIEIEDYDLCPRYSAKIFNNIPVIKSPDWLKNRLILCDYRPVDLIVDLTNYVMHETGQPLHAFDSDLLHSSKIIVRNAKKDERIVTIDDSTINLAGDTLVIADENKPVAVAGVMGGKDTEINENTRNVLLESANFSGPSIMRTSKSLGLRSEASNRFEKKLDPEITVVAIKRFEEILRNIAGKIEASGIYDRYRSKKRVQKINIRIDRVKDILGDEVNTEKILDILNGLYIKTVLSGKGDRILEASVPSFRFEDIKSEIDLIEEIARIYGYDKFKSAPPDYLMSLGRYTFSQKIKRELRQLLCDIGLNEVINYSFLSREWFKLVKLDSEDNYRDYVNILNPINEDFALLRTTPLPLMLKNVINNLNRGRQDIPIFEITRVFRDSNDKKKPGFSTETTVLGTMLSGRASKKSWGREERNYDFFDLKGILEYIIDYYRNGLELSIRPREYRFFHPVISGEILICGIPMGIIGKIHPEIIDNTGIKQEVFYMELNIDSFINKIQPLKRFKQIPAFPSIEIDLALVVDENIQNCAIEKEIRDNGTDILKSVRLFDIYRGKQIKEGKKSMAYSLTFQDESRTLKDSEVEIIVNRILENLSRKLNARLRE